MHKNSYSKMEWFKNKYLSNYNNLEILDVGSLDYSGKYNYSNIFNEKDWKYTGLDFEAGNNVDIVVSDIYNWFEVEDNTYDVVISGQFFEHLEFFWLAMSEIERVLKPGGYICIIIPSDGPKHGGNMPNCYRFDEDGLRAMAKYVDLEVLHASADNREEAKPWNDACLVAHKSSYLNIGGTKELEDRIDNLEAKLANLEKDYSNIVDSNNHLFNILFCDCEIKPKGILKSTQILCQELLDFVVNICEKYDLKYWLDYGNLLGAVRHGGFVPWDDDMDIGMMRNDYEKFLEVIEYELEIHDLNDDIEVQKLNLSNHVLFTQIFFRPKGTKGTYAGLDIFPYDFIESYDNDIAEKFKNLRTEYIKDLEEGVLKEDAIKKYFEIFKVSLEKTDYVISGIDGIRHPLGRCKFKVLNANKIFPLNTIEFNNKTYSRPKDSNYHLTEIYGEWRRIPNVIDKHNRMPTLKRNNESANENFEIFISKMRQINSLFLKGDN